jgi:hypothetical protein
VSGAFSVTGAVSGERGILIAELPGYMKGSYSFLAEANKNYTTKVILGQADVSTTLPAATGGIVSLSSGAQVVIPANAVTRMDGSTYNGTTVKVDVKEINEDLGAAFSAQIPGITLSAININNEEQELVSYGMLTVELYGDNNEALQLADGQTSELTFTIPAGQQASAPATIPLWYFDETIGLWREDGYATKQGNQYKGNVSHFTTWNCDQPHPPCTISGCLEDDLGNAQANITLQIGQITTQTDANGCFSVPVPAQFLPINISFADYVQMQSCLLYTLSSVINPSVNYNLGTIVLSNLNGMCLAVSTLPVVNILSTSATSGGNITNNGGPPVTQRGVVWSTTPNPTTANNNTIDGSGTGSFSSILTGLTANTTYYVRAYATTINGTTYGNEIDFNVIPTLNSVTYYMGYMAGQLEIPLTLTDTTFSQVFHGIEISPAGGMTYNFSIDLSELLGAPAGTLVPTVEGTLSGTTLIIANETETWTYQGINYNNMILDGTVDFNSSFSNILNTSTLTFSGDAIGTITFNGF